MNDLLVNALGGIAVALTSFVAGWWLHGETASPDPSVPDVVPEKPKENLKEKTVAKETLVQVHDVAVSMAASVGAHSTKIRNISDKLNLVPSSSSDDVERAVAELVGVNEQMQFQLQAAEERLKEQAAVIECNALEARTDVLTQLPNRRAFDTELEKRYERLKSDGEVTCVAMLDIDYFKQFNDKHGHQCGDAVLQAVAQSLRKAVRKEDTVARYGGEEFSVILPQTEISIAKRQAERMRRVVEDTVAVFDGIKLRVTVCVGVAQMFPGEGATLVVRRADDGLYASKRAGRNCSHWHDGVKSIRLAPEERIAVAEDTVPTIAESSTVTRTLAQREDFLDDARRLSIAWRQGGAEYSMLLIKVDEIGLTDVDARIAATEASLHASGQFLKTIMGDDDCGGFFADDCLALLLPHKTTDEATKIGERLRSAISRFQIPCGDGSISFTVSIGVASVERSDKDSESLIDRVEATVSDAIHHGSDQIVIAPASLCDPATPVMPS